MNRNIINHQNRTDRNGSLMPAIAVALLVIGLVAGLVLNRLWIDAAEVELRSAAEAAALAAAGEYLGDHLLVDTVDYDQIAESAYQRAVQVANKNETAGQAVELNQHENRDIYFGYDYFDEQTGQTVFLESNSLATGVVVRAQRTRQLGNPIALFFAGATDQPAADAVMHAQVSFDNLINHFQPTSSLHVPALPLAILAKDESGKRTDTWDAQITNKAGADHYSFDPETHQIIAQPDGIREMELISAPLNSDSLASNVQLLDFNNDLSDEKISEQILNGLNSSDLEAFGKVLPAQVSLNTAASANITTSVQRALEDQIGKQRLCLLYTSQLPSSVPGWSTLTCQGVVAIRVLKVIPESGESARLIVQPTVMTTRTAALVRAKPDGEMISYQNVTVPEQEYFENRYVYKKFISR